MSEAASPQIEEPIMESDPPEKFAEAGEKVPVKSEMNATLLYPVEMFPQESCAVAARVNPEPAMAEGTYPTAISTGSPEEMSIPAADVAKTPDESDTVSEGTDLQIEAKRLSMPDEKVPDTGRMVPVESPKVATPP
jgi:hypothetical protein